MTPPSAASRTVSAPDDQIAEAVGDWLGGLKRAGYGLAVLEGLPGAGKSTIVERLVHEPTCWIVELDRLLRQPEPDQDRSWADTVIARGAFAAISKEAAHGMTLVEGAAAWPVAQAWMAQQGGEVRVARAYLKAVSRQGGVTFWDAGEGLSEWALRHRRFLGSVYAYHAELQPWTTADVVFERIG